MNIETDKQVLQKVLAIAGDDESLIKQGIIRAMCGINDRARRTHLWAVLPRQAKRRVQATRRKATRSRAA